MRDSEVEIFIPASRPLGDQVIDVENISKAFGDKLLFENLSFRLPPGGIVGIIGPNGAGKTTLFRMLVGQEKPDSGTIKVGATVDIGYVDQNRDALDPNKTRLRGDLGRPRHDRTRQADGQRPQLRGQVQLHGPRPAEEGGHALRRRAEPRAPRQAAPRRRQPAPPRRADQRPRRRHAAVARGGDHELRRDRSS